MKNVHENLTQGFSEQQAFALLSATAQHLENGRSQEAETLLTSLIETQGAHSVAANVQSLIFARALLKNINEEKAEEANLYLKEFDMPQIELFDLLAKHVPLVNIPGQIVNEMICQFLRQSEEYVLLDIGIGSGRQEIMLLEQLASHSCRKLTLIGIEPAVDALREAEKAIRRKADELGIEVVFYPIGKKIEDFNREDWSFLENFRGKLVINEAFSLHHVVRHHSRGDFKDQVIERLYALDPVFFVLTEPHSDHETPSLSRRLAEAWSHFGATFRFIDQLSELDEHQKAALKTRFFAREIEDILQMDDSLRVERHEKAEQWISRLQKTKFRTLDLKDFMKNVGLPARSALKLSARQDYLSLDFEDQTIVSIIGAQAA